MKTVLITGYRGFTGQYVARLFRKKGYHVVGVVRNSPQHDEVLCDLTDANAVNEMIAQVRPDGIIHLAALSFVGHKEQSAFYQINVFDEALVPNAKKTHQAIQRAKEECIT